MVGGGNAGMPLAIFGSRRGGRILIIEDEAAIAAILEDMLQELGCSTIRRASTVT